MDIQLPSNFERLLFEASKRDGAEVARVYRELASRGESVLPAAAADAIAAAGFSAIRVGDDETMDEMRLTHAETGWAICPHTAVGLRAARHAADADRTIVTLATAHAAKFPETVERVLGKRPPMPERGAAFESRKEVFETGPMSAGFVRQRIESLVRERA